MSEDTLESEEAPAAVDPAVSNDFKILPGLGNFGDRYFGTTLDDTPPRLSHPNMSPVHLSRPVFNYQPMI